MSVLSFSTETNYGTFLAFPRFPSKCCPELPLRQKNLQETIVLLLLLAKYTNFSGFVYIDVNQSTSDYIWSVILSDSLPLILNVPKLYVPASGRKWNICSSSHHRSDPSTFVGLHSTQPATAKIDQNDVWRKACCNKDQDYCIICICLHRKASNMHWTPCKSASTRKWFCYCELMALPLAEKKYTIWSAPNKLCTVDSDTMH